METTITQVKVMLRAYRDLCQVLDRFENTEDTYKGGAFNKLKDARSEMEEEVLSFICLSEETEADMKPYFIDKLKAIKAEPFDS